MTRNKKIISLVILSLFLVASIAIGSFAWFTKSFKLGGAEIKTGELGLTSASYIFDATTQTLIPVTETVNDSTTNGSDATGSDAAGSSISVTGGTAFKDITRDNPLTFYLIVQKNEGSIDFKYAISAFLEGLEPTYEFASGAIQDLQSGAYNYINAGGFWYEIKELTPQTTLEEDGQTNYYTSGDVAKTALEDFIKADKVPAPSSRTALFEIGKFTHSKAFDAESDCHFYAVTVGVDAAAAQTGSYANQTIGIRAHIMASQSEEGETTTHTIAYEQQLIECLSSYKPGDTIQFHNSLSINGDIVFGAPVILDLNSHTLTVTGNVRFEYNLGYDTEIRTTDGGRLIVRSAGSEGGYAGGDLSIVTPASEVRLNGSNSAAVGQGDIYVQGTFSVMAAYDEGIIFNGCNVYAMTSEGQIPQEENIYKTINVYDATWVQITNGTTVGEIRIANKDVKLFRLLNSGTVSYVHAGNMVLSGDALSTPQIYIYNNGTIVGNTTGKHITLPAWSTKWKAKEDGSGYTGNTRIVQGFKSNVLDVTGANSYFKDHIEVESPENLVEIQDGDYQKLIVNYVENQNTDEIETLQIILDDFLQNNLDYYGGSTDRFTEASEVYSLITHLTVRTGYNKQITDGAGGDYEYLRSFTGLELLDLTDASTCYGAVDSDPDDGADGIPVLPYTMAEDGTVTQTTEYFGGSYYYIPAGALEGLSKLEDIRLPSNTQVILSNLMGNTTLEKTYPTITLPASVLAIEMNPDTSHALRQFYVIDMPTTSQHVKVYVGGPDARGEYDAQRFVVPDALFDIYRAYYGTEEELIHWLPTSQLDDSGDYLVRLEGGKYFLTAVVGEIARPMSLVETSTLHLDGQAIQVTGIYDYAFYRRTNIDVVRLAGIETIRASAFEEAEIRLFEGLDTLISVGEKAFKNMKWNQALDFEALETVGAEAFYRNSTATDSLKTVPSISMPGIVTIGDYAFANVIIEQGGTVAFGNTLTHIGTYAFERLRATTVTWAAEGQTEATVGSYAFANANVSGEMILPANVRSIESYAFHYATVGTLTFKGTITRVGERAFWGANTTALTFEDAIGTIEYNAFTSASNSRLGNLTFGGSIDLIMGTNGTSTTTGGLYNVKGTALVFAGKILDAERNAIYYLNFTEKVEARDTINTTGSCFAYTDSPTITFVGDISSTSDFGGRITTTTLRFDGEVDVAGVLLNNLSTDTLTFNGEVHVHERGSLDSVNARTSIIFNENVSAEYDTFKVITTPLFIFNKDVNWTVSNVSWYFRRSDIGEIQFNGYVNGLGTTFRSAKIGRLYIAHVGTLTDGDAFGANGGGNAIVDDIQIDRVDTLGAGLVKLTAFPDWEFQSVGAIATGFNQRTQYGTIKITGKVDSIATEAFKGVTVTSLEINDVGSIEKNAFRGANILSDLTFHNVTSVGESAFSELKLSGDLTFEGTVGAIGKNAFSAANISGGVYFRNTVASLGENAFGPLVADDGTVNPTTLSEVVFENDIKGTVGKYAFMKLSLTGTKAMEFKGNVQTIQSYAFEGTNLESLVFRQDVYSIGSYAFANILSAGATVKVMGNVTEFGTNILENTNASLVLLGVTESDDGNGGVTYTKVPGSIIATIGANAFKLSTIRDLYITDVTTVGSDSFNGSDIEHARFIGTVGTVDDSAFAGVVNIGTLQFDDKVTTLGAYVFAGDTEDRSTIQNLSFKQTLGTIGANTFANCDITNVEFCGDLTAISTGAFQNSHFAGAVTFEGNIATIGTSAFAGATFGGDFTVQGTVGEIQGEAFRGVTGSEFLFVGAVGSLSDTSMTQYSEGEATAKSLAFESAVIDSIQFKGGVGYIGKWAFGRVQTHQIVIGDANTQMSEYDVSATVADKAFSSITVTRDAEGSYSGSIEFYSYVDTAAFGTLNDGYSNNNAKFTVENRVYFRSVGSFSLSTNKNCAGGNSIGSFVVDHASSISMAVDPWGDKGTMTIGILKLNNTTAVSIVNVSTIREIYLPASLESFKIASVGGVQVFDWPENPSLELTLGGSALYNFKFVGNGQEGGDELVIPSQVKVLSKDAANGLSANVATFKGVTGVGQWCFAGSNVGTMNFPVLKTLDQLNAFHRLDGTHTLNLPELESITASEVFVACLELTTLNVPKLSTITKQGAFAGAPKLKNLSLPAVTDIGTLGVFGNIYENGTIGIYSFGKYKVYKYTYLETVELANLTNISGKIFEGNTLLTSLTLPKLTSMVITETVDGETVTTAVDGVFSNIANLTYLSLPKITSINSSKMFADLGNLETLLLPSVTTIGSGGVEAFSNCTKLTTLDLSSLRSISANYVFNNMRGIDQVIADADATLTAGTLNLPALVTLSGKYTFFGCVNITSLQLNVTTWSGTEPQFNNSDSGLKLETVTLSKITDLESNSSFYGIKSLKTFNAPVLVTISGDQNFIQSGLVTVNAPLLEEITGHNTFKECTKLVSVSLPKMRTLSGSSTFYSCTKLESISMPLLSVMSGTYTFQACSELSQIDLPLLTTLPDGSFKYCSKIPYLGMDPTGGDAHIMPKLISIGGSCFEDAKALTSIDLPDLLTTANYSFNRCTGLQTLKLPKLTDAGISAFAGTTSLKKVDLSALTSMGDSMFAGSGIETITLPSVTTNHSAGSVFSGCTSLKTVYMPKYNNVTRFYNMFNGCTSLTEVHWPALTNLSQLSADAFGGCTSLKILELGAVTTGMAENVLAASTGHVAVILNGTVTTATGSILNDTVQGIVIGNHGNAYVSGQTSAKYVELDEGWDTKNIGYFYDENEVLRYIYAVNGDSIQLLFCFDGSMTTQQAHADLRMIATETGKTVLTHTGCYFYTDLTGGELLHESNVFDLYGDVIENGVKITGVVWHDYSVTELVIPDYVEFNGTNYVVTQIDMNAFVIVKDHITSLALPTHLAAFDPVDQEKSGLIISRDVVLSRLEEFRVAVDNPEDGDNYSVDANGVLYDKNYTILILCPATLTVEDGILTVPATVTKLYIYAFLGNESVQYIQYAPTSGGNG